MFNWFKGKPSLPALQASLLAELLNKDDHAILNGTTIIQEGDIVFIREKGIEIVCNVLDQQDHGNSRLIFKIDFTININKELTFYEVMVAPGTNPSDAIRNGVVAFRDGYIKTFTFSVRLRLSFERMSQVN
jgi:NhaP-type Na+/H+ and K+/H+ antiporter